MALPPAEQVDNPGCPCAPDRDVRDDGDVWARLRVSPETPLPAGAAARYLDISVSHLYRMVARSKVGHYKPGGKKLYFLKRDLDEYAFRNRVATDEEIERRAATRTAN